MPPIDPEIQRLISRQLDGQLPESQRATLYRHLLKNPQARQTMEDYQANDHLAAAALAALWPAGQPPVVLQPQMASERRKADYRPFSIARLLGGMAAAAAVGLAAGTLWLTLRTYQNPPDQNPTRFVAAHTMAATGGGSNRVAGAALVDLDAAAENGAAVVPVADSSDEAVEFVGLVDEKENRVYLLKMERPWRPALGPVGDF